VRNEIEVEGFYKKPQKEFLLRQSTLKTKMKEIKRRKKRERREYGRKSKVAWRWPKEIIVAGREKKRREKTGGKG